MERQKKAIGEKRYQYLLKIEKAHAVIIETQQKKV